jgi:hypothetical protein
MDKISTDAPGVGALLAPPFARGILFEPLITSALLALAVCGAGAGDRPHGPTAANEAPAAQAPFKSVGVDVKYSMSKRQQKDLAGSTPSRIASTSKLLAKMSVEAYESEAYS